LAVDPDNGTVVDIHAHKKRRLNVVEHKRIAQIDR
jgi:hypothetical protein